MYQVGWGSSGWRLVLTSFLQQRKSPRWAGFLSFSILSSEYQTAADLLPGLSRYFDGEVLLYQGLLLSSGGEGA
jgi:hypothetical protein